MGAVLLQGNGLSGSNFRVCAVSGAEKLPTQARKNTIAVITDTPIVEWIMAPNIPGHPVPGMVWLKTSPGGIIQFNALRKNTLPIAIDAAFQYTDGSFQKKEVYGWNGERWVFGAHFLFENGNVYGLETGGYFSYGYHQSLPVITDTISCSVQNLGGSRMVVYTVNPIDFRNFTTLCVDLEYTTTATELLPIWVGVSQSGGEVDHIRDLIRSVHVPYYQRQTIEVPLDGLVGGHVVIMQPLPEDYGPGGTSTTVTIYQIYLR